MNKNKNVNFRDDEEIEEDEESEMAQKSTNNRITINYDKSKGSKYNLEKINMRNNNKNTEYNNYDDNSNISSSRTGKKSTKRKNNNPNLITDENLYTIQTITNTNNNTINIMDSLIVSEESQNDKSTENILNLSGIAANIHNSKNEHVSIISKNHKTNYQDDFRNKNKTDNINYENLIQDNNKLNRNEESKVKKIYDKGMKNYKRYLILNEELNKKIITEKKPPLSNKHKTMETYATFDNPENIEIKKFNINKRKTMKNTENHIKKNSFGKDDNYDNSTPDNKKHRNSINNEKLKIIESSISPIKYTKKVKFTQNELDEIIFKFLQDNNNLNANATNDILKSYGKTFTMNDINNDNNNLKNIILNEIKKDKFLDIHIKHGEAYIEYPNNVYNRNNHENNKNDYFNLLEKNLSSNRENTFNKKNLLLDNNKNFEYEKDYNKDFEKSQKLNEILRRIPDIIDEFNFKKDKIFKENSDPIENSIPQQGKFFNLNNLGKWMDLKKIDLNNNNTLSNTNNNINNKADFSMARKEILDEADNIINNHVLRTKKSNNDINNDYQNNLIMHVDKILTDNNFSKNNQTNNNITSIKNDSENHSRLRTLQGDQKDHNQESLNKKINYIYDVLKNFSNSKLKDLIGNPFTKIIKKDEESNLYKIEETYKTHLNENHNLENNLVFSDNKKISFEMPKKTFNLVRSENPLNNHIYHESKQNEEKEAFEKLLLSPHSKEANEDFLKITHIDEMKNIKKTNICFNSNDIIETRKQYEFRDDKINNHNIIKEPILNNSGISEIDKFNKDLINETNKDQITIKQSNPYDIIEQRVEKIIEDNFKLTRPDITETPEKKIYQGSKITNNTNLITNNKTDLESNQIEEKENSLYENEEVENEENLIDEVSKKIIFSRNDNENNKNNSNQENDENESSKDNQEKLNDQLFEEELENEHCLEMEEYENEDEDHIDLQEKENDEDNYSEEDPRSLDNCIYTNNNHTTSAGNKKENFINGKNLVSSEIKLKSRMKRPNTFNKTDQINPLDNNNEINNNNDNMSNHINNKNESIVKFEGFLHSQSLQNLGSSRNKKNKNYLNNRNNINNTNNFEQRNIEYNSNDSDLEIENENVNDMIKSDVYKNVVSDLPYNKKEKCNRVRFSEKLVFIEYDEDSIAEDIKVYNQLGKPEKHQKFNLLKYLIRIKNNKYKAKKILHYYYKGIRDDRIPEKLWSSLKRSNSFSEQDKELGLKKLNEFLDECNKENQLSEVQEQNKKRIGNKILNLNFFFQNFSL